MLDIGWSELLLIGVVALIVVGPKDLPHLFHALGRFTAKARAMAREFTSAMDDAARESGINDAAKTLNDLKSVTSRKSLGLDALDRAADRFEKWDPAVPGKRRSAQPDPSAPNTPAVTPNAQKSTPLHDAADSTNAASASAQTATRPPVSAPSTTDLPAGSAQPVGTPASEAHPSADQSPSRRRLRAVRRSDMKDL